MNVPQAPEVKLNGRLPRRLTGSQSQPETTEILSKHSEIEKNLPTI